MQFFLQFYAVLVEFDDAFTTVFRNLIARL